MPTKSKNTGGHGGARPGAGRKKKALSEKINSDTTEPIKVLNIPDMHGEEMPNPHEFLSAEQRDGSKSMAPQIYKETWEWLRAIGCSSIVSTHLVERYAMSMARWIQCEEITSKLGFLSKHPTTGKPIPSPYINIGINYMNQADRCWYEIFQIVKENCSTDYTGNNPRDALMETMLSSLG